MIPAVCDVGMNRCVETPSDLPSDGVRAAVMWLGCEARRCALMGSDGQQHLALREIRVD